MQSLNEFEASILMFIQNNVRIPALNLPMSLITMLGDKGIIAILFTLLLMATRRYRKVGFACALSLVLEVLITNVLIKNLVARIRPYDVQTALQILTVRPDDFSFPSGHTGSVFAVAMVMSAWMPKRWGVPAVIMAVLISLSRLYVGVHYPTDVVCAAIIGCFTAFIARAVVKKCWPSWKKRYKILSI